jgi:hypothetical protein
MKSFLQKIFSPIIAIFESNEENFTYKSSHRTILIVVGFLFLLLTIGVLVVGLKSSNYGFVFPLLIFGGAGMVSLVVGCLGSDSAVAKIWNSRKS